MDEKTLSAIPGAGSSNDAGGSREQARTKRVPVASLLTHPLPPEDEVSMLLEDYFRYVHWFSLIILEPRWRPSYAAIKDGHAKPSRKPFMLLLSSILGVSAWYRSQTYKEDAKAEREYWQEWSRKLIENAELQITHLLDQSSIVSIQILTLLGSFYVYHGRPNLSFSLLGATVKAAQAAGLHQETKNIPWLDIEERRRLWWTIYTWDRFASITYGRPLGINDRDCNVAMPSRIIEDTRFLVSHDSASGDHLRISFTAYQRSLNELYLIASPAIETLYSARESRTAPEEYLALLQSVTVKLWQWRQGLTEELRLDLDDDATLKPAERAHRLQALSLHLTFESLQIILHRPFLRQHLQLMASRGPQQVPSPLYGTSEMGHPLLRPLPSLSDTQNLTDLSSPVQFWEAALRTAQITELHNLVDAAVETHLVSFFALNLFNAAIVMVVLALSDPLHDRAQQAKRAVTRIYRLQLKLGNRSVLSKQSSQVIHTLVELLLRREREAILEPFPTNGTASSEGIVGPSTMPTRRGSAEFSQFQPAPGGGVDEQDWMNANISNSNMAMRLDSSLESVQKGMRGVPTRDSL
ncbi:hypothetical protein LTR22_026496 [Elasticomyces elasticus]|nr:hypothetical protein LTR22_026496 [Elasticomyces elasticus]